MLYPHSLDPELQMLYKVSNPPKPAVLAKAFQLRLEKYTGQSVGLPMIAGWNIAHMAKPEINRILRQTMASDMRLSLDISGGEYIRGYLLQTGENEGALLITMALTVAPYISVENVLAELNESNQGEYITIESDTICPEQAPHGALPTLTLPYGKNIGNAPYKQDVCEFNISDQIVRGLRSSAKDDNAFIAMLSVTWGLLLKETGNSEPQYPLLLALPQGKRVCFRLVPVSMPKGEDSTCEEIVAGQTEQIVKGIADNQSQTMNYALNHWLCFENFAEEVKEYTEIAALPEGSIVSRRLWATQNLQLGLYFERQAASLTLTVVYDPNRFKPYGIGLMVKRYLLKLQQMLLDWKQIAVLAKPTSPSAAAHVVNGQNTVYRMMTDIPFFEGLDIASLQRDIKNPRLLQLSIGNQVPFDDLADNCLFLAEGAVARSLITNQSYSNVMDMSRPGAWLNETSILRSQRTKLILDVMSDEANIIVIPWAELNRLMHNHSVVERRILLYVVNELDKYQKLWVQIL